MPAIGIVDDRQDHRTTLRHLIEVVLDNKWKIIDIEPFPEENYFQSWIYENEISVLLIDEKLNEQTEKCKYNGHDLVLFLRKHLPTFPIYVITSYPEEPELLERFQDVEEIIDRVDFSKDAEKYIPRFVRAAQQYFNSYQDELAKLSDKSKLVALGKAKKKDLDEIKALQSKLGLAFPYEDLKNRSDWLTKLDEKLYEMENLAKEIETFLSKVK